MLMKPDRTTEGTLALRHIEDRFNYRLKYPYVIFMAEDEAEAITDDLRVKVNWVTEGRATFATISQEQWAVPDNLDKARINESLNEIGFTLGYRSMCRFFSGWFWRHPALQKYDWFWRLDTDIVFHCDVPYDPFQRMVSHGALYGFTQIGIDAVWAQPSLPSNVSLFLSENAHLVPKDANLGFVWDSVAGIQKAMSGQAGIDEWTKGCMYNNFEISHRSVWESELYTKLFSFLDGAGGFFYERWGDAPVHSFGIAISLRKEQALQFTDMGYQHKGWPFECAAVERCLCAHEGVSVDFKNGTEMWYDVANQPD